MKYSKEEVREATERLKKLLKPGDNVYTILRHVSRSGMSRDISVLVIWDDGSKFFIDWDVSRVLGYPLAKNQGVKVGGCGMDMGFYLVDSLSSVLFRDEEHKDAGYFLKQSWL